MKRSRSSQVSWNTINKRALELICHSHSHNCIRPVMHKFKEDLQLPLLQLEFSVLAWTISLGYGLDFLLGKLALERGTPPWLAIGSRVCFQNYSLCQG
jgi:hypothetical protein